MHRLQPVATVLLAAALSACAGRPALDTYPTALGRHTLDMTTWSVVGVDRATGAVGVAMASCVPKTHAVALAALVPGKGAAATQAGFDVGNRNKVFAALKEGLSADDIITRVADSTVDARLGNRQYGVVTMKDGNVKTAGFTGRPMLAGDTAGGTRWAGVRADASRGVSAQGNTLASSQVVSNALAAFVWEDPAGFNTLPDRLMRAVEAGSIAGGDVRCNTESTRQTAATAMIVVARGGDAPYATDSIGKTNMGTPAAPWLELSVTVDKGGDNPLLELRRRFDEWRRGAKMK